MVSDSAPEKGRVDVEKVDSRYVPVVVTKVFVVSYSKGSCGRSGNLKVCPRVKCKQVCKQASIKEHQVGYASNNDEYWYNSHIKQRFLKNLILLYLILE